MKKTLLLSLFLFLVGFILFNLYFLDKTCFLCPIEYKRDIIIRNDSRGDGFFGASRRGKRLHQGIDLFTEVGTPVLASCSGRVVSAAQNRGMGKYVVIQHPDNIRTVYGHLSRVNVRKNQLVRQGQLIGRVGKTGNARHRDILPHLHFEVRENGIPQDPMGYLP